MVPACVLPCLVQEAHGTQEGFTEGYKVLVGMDTTGAKVRAAPGPRVTITLKVRVIDIKNASCFGSCLIIPQQCFFFPFFPPPVR